MNYKEKYTYKQRLNYAYKNIQSIVQYIKQNNLCRIEHIAKFERNINSILPKNDHEMLTYKMIRELYTNNRDCFIQLIMKNNRSNENKIISYILLTDAKVIREFFDISDFIFISWNSEKNKFLIDIPRKNLIKNEADPVEPEPKKEILKKPIENTTDIKGKSSIDLEEWN